MKQVFYYLRSKGNNLPRITVCLVQNEEGFWSRGVSICSLSEKQVVIKKGRDKAFGRAIKALINKKSSMPCFRIEAIEVYDACDLNMAFAVKSEYNCFLNEFEKKLVSKCVTS